MAIYDFGHLVYETNCLVLLITNLPILHVTRESMTPRMTLLRETTIHHIVAYLQTQRSRELRTAMEALCKYRFDTSAFLDC
jgi:hypothetical protein